eukprot:SAG11_NODE_743_length_7407_cov_2.941434_6_plen_92_part_00
MDLLNAFKKTGSSTADLIALVNKQPVWSAEKNMYILDFKGRVTMASMRNFQAVQTENGENKNSQLLASPQELIVSVEVRMPSQAMLFTRDL